MLKQFRHLAAAAPLFLAGCGEAATSQPSNVRTVSSAEELQAALKDARAGMEIRVAPGEYGALNLRGRKIEDGWLTVTAAGPQRPVFSSVSLSRANGIIVSGLQLTGPGRPVISIINASNIILSDNLIGGATLNDDPWDETGTGFRIRFSRHVTVLGNKFTDLFGTGYIQGSDGVIIAENEITKVREGFNVASTANLYIERNYFHGFSPKFQNGEHPDSIQFWTAREKQGARNVRIAENVMLHGICGAIQGIFIRSERATVRHSNITIERNVYYGASKHGVTLGGTDGGLIANNVIVGSPYSESGIRRNMVTDPRCGGSVMPALISGSSTGITLKDNMAPIIGKTQNKLIDNLVIGPKGDSYAKTFGKRPEGETPPLSAFVSRPGSNAAKKGAGISATFPFGRPADTATALSSALRRHAELGPLPPPPSEAPTGQSSEDKEASD